MTVHAALQNRVAFLINNISPKNVDSKVNEMRDLITQELWPWFANYMVVKRAAQVRMLQVWTLGDCALQELCNGKKHRARALFPQLHRSQEFTWAPPASSLSSVLHLRCPPPSSWLLCSQFYPFSWRLVHLQEPNFHVAYVELLEKMDKGAMQKHLAVTTYKYIKVLLKSDRIKTQVSHSGAMQACLACARDFIGLQESTTCKLLCWPALLQAGMG